MVCEFGFKLKVCNRKPALQIGGVGFERSGHLGGRGDELKTILGCIMGSIGSSVYEA